VPASSFAGATGATINPRLAEVLEHPGRPPVREHAVIGLHDRPQGRDLPGHGGSHQTVEAFEINVALV